MHNEPLGIVGSNLEFERDKRVCELSDRRRDVVVPLGCQICLGDPGRIQNAVGVGNADDDNSAILLSSHTKDGSNYLRKKGKRARSPPLELCRTSLVAQCKEFAEFLFAPQLRKAV